MNYPPVLPEDATIDAALAGRSLSRFGDGELRLAIGGDCISQKGSPEIASALRALLGAPHTTRSLICIPNAVSKTPKSATWDAYRTDRFVRLYRPGGPFGSSFVTRPDSAPWIDRPDYWDKVRALWRDRSVVFVTGTERSLRLENLASASEVREVSAPPRDAFAQIDRIEADVIAAAEGLAGGPPLVILCIGATSTVLAERLAPRMQALDLGHMGMFMRHAGAYAMTPDELMSPAYRKQNAELHRRPEGYGGGGRKHVEPVETFAAELGARSVLDYGCGEGTLKTALKAAGSSLKIAEYDPAIPGKEALPKPIELLVSTDVLEHIEPDRLDAVLKHMGLLARKGLFVIAATRVANKILPDGRNAHLIIKTPEWWIERLTRAWPDATLLRHDGKPTHEVRLWFRK